MKTAGHPPNIIAHGDTGMGPNGTGKILRVPVKVKIIGVGIIEEPVAPGPVEPRTGRESEGAHKDKRSLSG